MTSSIVSFPPAARPANLDTGLCALALVSSVYRISADPGALAHELALGGKRAGGRDIARAAAIVGLKAKLIASEPPPDFGAMPRPAIIKIKDGRYFVLGRMAGNVDNLTDPLDPQPQKTTPEELNKIWGGEAILLTRRATLATVAAQFEFKWFLNAVWRYRTPLSHVLIASFFLQIFALATPLFFQVVIDKVLVHKSVSTLEIVVSGLIVLGLFDVTLQYLRSYALYHAASRIDVELGSQLFDRLLKLTLGYFETRPAGQTVARVRELETIRSFLTGQALTSVIDLAFTVVFLAFLLTYSVTLTLIVVASIPAYILVAMIIRPILRDKISEKFNRGAESQQFLVESVVGAPTLKASAVEPIVHRQWEERLAAYVKTSFQAVMIGTLGQSIVQYINKLVTALILLLGAKAVISGELTVGGLIAFNMLANQLTAPILRLSQLWQDFQQVQISVERVGDVLNAPIESHSDGVAHLPQSEVRGQIIFQNVSFRYRPGAPEVLKNLSLEIPVGQVIGIVGRSGSGKSTFTKLVQRMYLPERGRITVDGIDIAEIHPAWVRRQIGVVLQENLLFNRTIHENIALAIPTLSRDRVVALARLSGAHEFISDLPQGYDTHIEERGANLSGGQRQRIAIARALATGPRILILDEATSALDYESERVIQENMKDIVRGRTVIIVAHRLAAVRDCDRIIAMERGEITEDGSHEQLLRRKGGLYAHLWALQGSASA